MSYNYDELVSQIAKYRRAIYHDECTTADEREEALQKVLDVFETLSKHCPMTPLLWMQYGSDTEAYRKTSSKKLRDGTEGRLELLELGVKEFPGCALLQLYYLQELCQGTTERNTEVMDRKSEVLPRLREALLYVGRGSHQNEDKIIAQIYSLYLSHIIAGDDDEEADDDGNNKVIEALVQRARTPMKDANEALADEIEEFCNGANIELTPQQLKKIEQGRRWASKVFRGLTTLEDDVDLAMHEEGILWRHSVDVSEADPWDDILSKDGGRFWMGLGGAKTAGAFVKYARGCSYFNKAPKEKDNEQENDDAEKVEHTIRSLAISVFERGVAECPTVESLWVAYIKYLTYLVERKLSYSELSPSVLLESVCRRAVRNCPYSTQLYGMRLSSVETLANAGHAVFDPDVISKMVQEAVDSKFLTTKESCLQVHQHSLNVVKRRIQSLLCKASMQEGGKPVTYDGAEAPGKKGDGSNSINVHKGLDDEETEEEVQDLVDDLREMYEMAEASLRKMHGKWTMGRAKLCGDRALTEAYLLGPVVQSLSDEESQGNSSGEAIRCFNKWIGVHQPTSPDAFASYINFLLSTAKQSQSAVEVIDTHRKVRGLYHRAMSLVKKQLNAEEVGAQESNDHIVTLHALCHDFLKFEQIFGSEDSYKQAHKQVKGKLRQKGGPNGVQVEQKSSPPTGVVNGDQTIQTSTAQDMDIDVGKKRKRDDTDNVEDEPDKKQKVANAGENHSAPKSEKKTNLKVDKAHPVYKVKIGKMEYPAHPFTVHLSNLAPETQDMDLVDLFKPRCGVIVHARILREKHQPHSANAKAKSKGSALIQFEERESVEKALELHEVLGLHEKLIRVSRSHVPAVALVPPGMHRVVPKGEGRSSKRNLKRKEKKVQEGEAAGNDKAGEKPDKAGEKPKGEERTDEGGAASEKTKTASSVLAFRPRNLHKPGHHKVMLDLGGMKKTEPDDKKE